MGWDSFPEGAAWSFCSIHVKCDLTRKCSIENKNDDCSKGLFRKETKIRISWVEKLSKSQEAKLLQHKLLLKNI